MIRPCQWCGASYESAHPNKLYCSTACKHKFGNFMGVVGKRLAASAMAWRSARGRKGVGSAALQDMVQMLDKANEEFRVQRPKGAPSITAYYTELSKNAGVTRALDK